MSLLGILSGCFQGFRLDCGPMKTKTLLSTLFISSVLGLSACTPRDVDLGLGGGGGNRNARTNNRGGNGGSGDALKLGSYSLAALFASRQLEAIELIKVATKSSDPNVFQYIVTAQETKDGLQNWLVEMNKSKFRYDGPAGTWTVENKKVYAVSFSKNDTLESFQARISNNPVCVTGKEKRQVDCRLSINGNASQKGFYANAVDTEYTVDVKPGSEAETLVIEISSKGYVGGAKGAANENTDMQFKSTLVVDKASLETEAVKVLKAEFNASYPSPDKTKTFTTTMKGSNLTANIKNQCSGWEGKFSVKAGSSFDLTWTADTVAVSAKNWNQPLAECGQRPTVDVSLLHL